MRFRDYRGDDRSNPLNVAHAQRWGVAVLCAALLSCVRPPTAVIVIVDTDLPRNAPITLTLVVRVGDAPIAVVAPPDQSWQIGDTGVDGGTASSGSFPVSFGVVPAPDEPRDQLVTLRVVAQATSATLTRSVRFRFLPGQTTTVRLFLTVQCASTDTRCGPDCTRQQYCESIGQTCGDDGECTVVSTMPIEPNPDVPDVAVPDAATDARDAGADVPTLDVRPDSGMCPAGTRLCGSSCVDPTRDPNHCGACFTACAPGQTCVTARCTTVGCGAGMQMCGTRCVSLSDPTACGPACATCVSGPNATPVCVGATCAITCTPGFGDCDSNPATGCETPLGTAANCNACGAACGAGEVCTAGTCTAIGCVPRTPVTAFDASPTSGNTCGTPTSVLAADRVYVGLDYVNPMLGAIDGMSETGCVGADFGSVVMIGSIQVAGRASSGSCGTTCSMTTCMTGWLFDVFAGSTMGAYRFVGQVSITSGRTDAVYTQPYRAMARYVVVCRTAAGMARDDVSIDAIAAACP